MPDLPLIVADLPLTPPIERHLDGKVRIASWEDIERGLATEAVGAYTFRSPRIDDRTLDKLPNLKVVSNHGVGVDHIDVPACARRGVLVANTPGALDDAVADLAMGLLIIAARRLGEAERYARSEQFTTVDPAMFHGVELLGRTLGIVGLGGIGLKIAERAAPFGLKIVYHNRKPRPSEELRTLPSDTKYLSLDELLATSDFVMLIMPLTPETNGLIDATKLAKMKSTAMLINMARGAVVDTQALYETLRDRRIAGAALDVTEPEPLPRNHPLITLDNVFITPHLGSATVATRERMAQLSVENLLLALEDKPPRFVVTPR